jgi:hypothetical protein
MAFVFNPISFAPSHLNSTSRLNGSSESLVSADSYSSASSSGASSKRFVHISNLSNFSHDEDMLGTVLVEYTEVSGGDDKDAFAHCAFGEMKDAGFSTEAPASLKFIVSPEVNYRM